jgi:hypothetical protein
MNEKFQPTPSSASASQKFHSARPRRLTQRRRGDQDETRRHDRTQAEAHDQRAGKEARREHADDVPLQAECGSPTEWLHITMASGPRSLSGSSMCSLQARRRRRR